MVSSTVLMNPYQTETKAFCISTSNGHLQYQLLDKEVSFQLFFSLLSTFLFPFTETMACLSTTDATSHHY